MSTPTENILATNGQRKRIYDRMEEWGLLGLTDAGESGPHRLAQLLGYTNFGDFAYNCNERDVKVLQALAGPHGYAFYRLLKIQRGATDG